MIITCFHNPDEENGYLSDWYISYFEVGGIKFSSMEQYMMYRRKQLVAVIIVSLKAYLKLMILRR